MTCLLRKPCLDISMWAGYDSEDHQKNLAYYNEWYERFVAGAEHSDDTRSDIFNKYEVRITTHADASSLLLLQCMTGMPV